VRVLSTEEVSPNVYRVVTESEKYGIVSQTVLMMPETTMQKCPDCFGKGGLEYEPGCIISVCDRCHGRGILGDVKDLREYIRNNPCKGFKPIPHHNKDGNQIEWFWKNDSCYAESIMHDEKWIGSIYRSQETKEIVGVEIHLESVK